MSCDPCSEVGSWFARRQTPTLQLRPAEEHRQPLRRVRYERADGTVLSGIRAVAAALEHVSLGYALLGWIMRAPVIAGLLQLLVDAAGGGPRSIGGQASDRSETV